MATSASIAADGDPGSLQLADATTLVARALLALIFIGSGAAKIADPAGPAAAISAAGLPFAQLGVAVAVVAELGGGLGMLLGYRTRVAAATLAAFSLATALLFHFAFADQNQMIHFLKNLAMVGGLLQVATFGAGRLSLDARLSAAKP